jgi:hypothetical protein
VAETGLDISQAVRVPVEEFYPQYGARRAERLRAVVRR